MKIENKNRHEDEICAKEEMLLFMKNEIHRYEDKIRAIDEMLLFMENEIYRCDKKLDASDEMLLKYENEIDQCYKELNKTKDLSITKETMYDKELRQNKLEIENCEYKSNIKNNIISKCEKFVNDIDKIFNWA
ncbi:24515_t:CDS:2 [Dentiscutata erythropus]|uniref:24515_t:CDS:1 n=1 Tax=Dentiscutata erythropus TaxID=1348616 RepID=A0A9N9F5Q9_9GLOM|nr:24515_t:CDS:2 [Dentiscutata erythropus]